MTIAVQGGFLLNMINERMRYAYLCALFKFHRENHALSWFPRNFSLKSLMIPVCTRGTVVMKFLLYIKRVV